VIITDLYRCQDWVSTNYNVCGSEFTAAIGYEKDGEIRCVTGYNHFNGKSCHTHFYYKGGYVPKDYLWFIHYYPFIQCGLDMLIAIIASANDKIVNLCHKLGYIEQYRLLHAHPEGDLMLATMQKDNCRFLGGSYARR